MVNAKKILTLNLEQKAVTTSLLSSILSGLLLMTLSSITATAQENPLYRWRPPHAKHIKSVRTDLELLRQLKEKYFDCDTVSGVWGNKNSFSNCYITTDASFHIKREAFDAPVPMTNNELYDFLHYSVLPSTSERILNSWYTSVSWDEIMTEGELWQIRTNYFRRGQFAWDEQMYMDGYDSLIQITNNPPIPPRQIIKRRLSLPIFTNDSAKAVVFSQGIRSSMTIDMHFFHRIEKQWVLLGSQCVGFWPIPSMNKAFMDRFWNSIEKSENYSIVNQYVHDIRNLQISTEDLILKYHNVQSDSIAENSLKVVYTSRRAYLLENDFEIEKIESIDQLPSELQNLIWDGELFFIISDIGKYLFPVLINDEQIIGTSLITKGKRKYVLSL